MPTLYEQLCRIENLSAAWDEIQHKGKSGGIDGVTLEEFAAHLNSHLERLGEELRSGAYAPQPYKAVKIPKGNNDFRTLGLMTVRDKVVQRAACTLLEPLLDRMFLDVSYAYRKDKGPGRAIARVSHLLFGEKREWVVRCDIARFFDTINHDRLTMMLEKRLSEPRLLNLIKLWLKMGRVDNRLNWTDAEEGIAQGGVISPLLANFYLGALDHEAVRHELAYVRYADDYVAFCHTREEAESAYRCLEGVIKGRLKLKLNPESRVTSLAEGFEFLGITFRGSERLVSDKKLESLKEKVRTAVKSDAMLSLKHLSESLQGIEQYYGKILPQRYLELIDESLTAALKDEARRAWLAGAVTSKQILVELLNGVTFLSKTYQIRKNGELKGILVQSARKERAVRSVDDKDAKAIKQGDPVQQRKKEYAKLQAEGFELVVHSPGAFIGKTQKGIVVKVRGAVLHEAPLANLKHIIITSLNVTLSSNVIAHAAERKIPIDFISQGGMPYARIFPFQSAHAPLQLAQLATHLESKGSILARAFVSGKIRNQMNLAKYYHKYRKGDRHEEFNKEFTKQIATMESMIREVKGLAELDHETLRGKLMGYEGVAAAAYWVIMQQLLTDVIDFSGRIGQGATDQVNSMLNYGYGILYAKIWHAVSRQGFSPYLSFLHKPQSGKPTLIYDLIEEFRAQIVDRVVFSMLTRGTEFRMDGDFLAEETRKKLATAILERINTAEPYRGRSLRLGEIIREQAKGVAEYLLGEAPHYVPYVARW